MKTTFFSLSVLILTLFINSANAQTPTDEEDVPAQKEFKTFDGKDGTGKVVTDESKSETQITGAIKKIKQNTTKQQKALDETDE